MQTPDPWQVNLLTQLVTRRDNVILACSSQVGKTEVVSVGAYLAACLGLYVLVVSPSDRQSIKFHQRLLEQHARLNLVDQVEQPNKHELWLESGGHIEAVPNSPDKIRGIAAVDLLVVDEASRVSDELYGAVTRMLRVSKGKTALLSTPFGRRGFFWREWENREKGNKWRRHEIPWTKCPRITKADIDDERRQHGERWVRQEWECSFEDNVGSLFSHADIQAALCDDVLPLFQEDRHPALVDD